MDKSIETKINKIYIEVYNKVFTKENIHKLSLGSRTNIEATLTKLTNSKKYAEFAEKFAKELAKKGLDRQKGIWRKYFEAAKRNHIIGLPTTFTEYQGKMMSNTVKHNFEMIKSIPNKIMEILNHKYTSTLIEEVAKGTLPRGSFQKMLEKHGHKQARVIARTETAKLQTVIMENRATSLGSVCYEWRASNDKRTRPSHKAMNGVIVFWGEGIPKPTLDGMTGHAGEYPNCRCNPNPILDKRDLTKSNYKVWDYNKNEIVSMTKGQLIEKIKGE